MFIQKWSEEELSILELLGEKYSTKEISSILHILNHHRTSNAVRKKLKRLNIRFKDYEVINHSLISPEVDRAIRQINKQRKDYIEETTSLTPAQKSQRTKQSKTIISGILQQLQDAREKLPIVHTQSFDSVGKRSLVLLFSDWHYGLEVINPQTGIHTYNKQIATNRILSIPSLLDKQVITGCECELVIIFAGDMVSGEGIFPGQEWVTEEYAIDQVTQLTQMIWRVINELKDKFWRVRIVTCKGNHGRTGGSSESNWDNVLYKMLELLVATESPSDVFIKNRPGEFNICNIQGWKHLIRHHAPVQADTSAGIAKFASWGLIHDYDSFVYGHWHHWGIMTVSSKPIFRNGSLVGGDDFAETLAKYDSPVQLCWEVTEENICNWIKPIIFGEK